MLIRSFLSPVLCSALLTLVACDKEESLGEVESETSAESESSSSETNSQSESGSGDTEGDSESGVNCPTDAMVCPDGSAVGRSGPDCAFDPCPGESDSDSSGEPPPQLCPPDAGYYEPAGCPMKTEGTPYVIDPDCYVGCSPDAPTGCDGASVCMVVEINPCICDEGEDCCDACGSADALCIPVLTGEACEGVTGNYLSLEEYECGISPDGVEMCSWQINLEDSGEYLWTYSDIGEGGNYACKDGVITLANNPSHSATYDPTTEILTWDGIEYGHVEF